DLVDPSMLRPGRLSTHILVPLPDDADRAAILRVQLRDVTLPAGPPLLRMQLRVLPLAPALPLEDVLADLVPRTAGYAGADLRLLCDEAKLLAMQSAASDGEVRLSGAHVGGA